MDIAKTFLVLDRSASVTVMETTELCEYARKRHDLSPVATAALGRVLTVTSFMSSKFKDEQANMSVTIDGDGPLGKIVTAGTYGGKVRGYVENPLVDLPLREDGKLNVGGAVGKGFMRVVTDLKLKEPYAGQVELVSGEIGEDFAYYFTVSEQQPSAVAVGVLVNSEGVLSAGGVFIQPLPNISDDALFILEDIATNFTNVSSLIAERGVDGVIEDYFSHIVSGEITEFRPEFRCSCSSKKIRDILSTLSDQDIADVLEENGRVVVHCGFCNTDYAFTKEEIERLRA